MYLVFDLGGTNIKIAYCNENGEFIEKYKEKTPKKYNEFITLLEKYIEGKNIKGIAFSSPGSVDSKSFEIKGISAIEYIHKYNFCKYLKDKYKLNISIENDANCAALGEIYFTENKNITAMFLIIGTGLGGAIVYKGKLIKGINNEAGEFGYIKVINKNGEVENTSRAVTLANVVTKLANEKKINTDTFELLDKYFNNIEPYYTYTKISLENISTLIYNLKYTFDPECIFIGGAISEEKRYIDEIKKYVKKEINIEIKPCKNFNDNNILGALAKHLQEYGN